MQSTIISEIDNQKVVIEFYHGPQEQETEPEVFMDKIFTNRKYQRWNAADLACLKKSNPTISENDLECLSVELTLNELLGPTKYEEIIRSVASTQPTLSKTEAQSMYILMELLGKKPEYLMSYIYSNGIFPGILFKSMNNSQPNALFLLDNALKQNPRWPVELAMSTLAKVKKYPVTLYSKLDHWLASHLKNTNFKKQSQSKEFVEDLASYLRYSSKEETAVSRVVCSKIDDFNERDQYLLWDQILCQNTTPQKQREAVLSFLENSHSTVANRTFYYQIGANISSFELEEILGSASDTAKKNYFKILKDQKQELTEACIKKDGVRKFLCWDLYEKGKISDKEMMEIIQKYDTRNRIQPAKRSFLFQDKARSNWDIFELGCRKFKSSPLQVLMWISSFSKKENFGSWLASSWESLPTEIRQNPNIQLAMDNRFDLLYQLAYDGNTSMMNEIMKMMNNYPDFIRRLMRPHENGDTCLHQLCHKGKKGLLKLLDKLPEAEQQRLLNQKNDMGQSPLNMCSDDFRRFLDQKNFIRPQLKKQEDTIETILEKEVDSNEQNISYPEEVQILCPQFCSKRFNADKEKLSRDKTLIRVIDQEVLKLRKMALLDLQARVKQDMRRNLKSRMSVTNFRFADITYRMGYLFQNGIIGLLFVLPHHQYEKELHPLGYLDKMAVNVRNQINAQITNQRNGGRN